MTEFFRDSFPVHPPNGWCRMKIRESIVPIDASLRMRDDEEYRLVSVRRRFGGMFDRERLPGRQILTKNLQGVLPGSFIVARMQIVHGACCLVPEQMRGAAVSESYIQFASSEHCDMAFFSRLAQLPEMSKLFLDASQGVVIEKMTFDLERWLSFSVNLPPLPEQRQIAAILDTIDDAIRKTEQIIAKLKQVKQGLLHDVLTRGIDDNGELRDPERHPEQFKDSPLGLIPSHWNAKRLGDLSPRLAGRLIVQPHQYFAEQGVPVVFGTNIRPGSIRIDGIKRISFQADARFAHCRIRAGDLLTVRVGVPGMTAVVPRELDGCHFASTMWIRGADSFVSEWLCHCMNSSLVRRQIESANYGSVQTQFNIREAASFVLPLPPLPEQVSIVELLTAFDNRVGGEESALRTLGMVKQGLMEDLLTGRVRVTALLESAAE